jgi:uncharacterized protein (TIGR00251 family)
VIAIAERPEGVVISIRAQPNARKTAVSGEHGGALKVTVAAPPEDGRANAAIVELLRNYFGLKRSQIELISGLTSRNKTVLIRGLSANDVAQKLATL